MPASPDTAGPVLSIVVPLYNERDNIRPLLERLRAALADQPESWELICVDDGSADGTAAEITALAADEPRLRLLRLARNFGHQAALVAGLAHARGAAVVTLDGDLQHPPELIPELLHHWRNGGEIVQAVRHETAGAGPLKRATSRSFYRLLSLISRVPVTPGAADFRLMTRAAVAAFLACGERCRFNRGLVRWIGFRHVEVPYTAAPRHAGRSKYSYRAMLRLAGDAIFSFSSWPLRLAGLAGALVSLLAGAYLLYVLAARLFTDRIVPGWSSILAAVLGLGGVNLIVLWILGEYVGRMYEEVKHRPIYIVRPPEPAGPPAPGPPAEARPPGTPAAEPPGAAAAGSGHPG